MKPFDRYDIRKISEPSAEDDQVSDLDIERKWVLMSGLDLENFGFFYDKYYDAIFGFAFLKTGEQDLACDVANETFTRALDGAGRFQWRGYSVGAWLFRIARNVLMSEFRARHRMPEVAYEPEMHDPRPAASDLDTLAADQESFLLLKCVGELSTDNQDVFIYHYWLDMTTKQVSVVMDMPEGSVKTILQRGRTAMLHRLLQSGMERGLSEMAIRELKSCAAKGRGWKLVDGEGEPPHGK